MRPVIEKSKFGIRHIIYIIVALICATAIGVTVYFQFFKDEKIGVIFGITEEENEEYKTLKENFLNTFTNNTEVLHKSTYNVKKIKQDEGLIIIGYEEEKKEEKYEFNIKIPYFNINSDVTKRFNESIKENFKDKIQNHINESKDGSIVYSVKYKAYLNDNIISLIVLSELKQENNNQRIMIKTYNYNLEEDKQISIDELLKRKNIDINYANKVIKEEIESSQKQNTKLAELGYSTNIRDTNSSKYKIKNAETFFIGPNDKLYIIYPYGNEEVTSEMDIVIL